MIKFKIYDKIRNRCLTEEELDGKFYYTGEMSQEFPLTEEFSINLVTGKVQTPFDITECADNDCDESDNIIMVDSDDFELMIEETLNNRLN